MTLLLSPNAWWVLLSMLVLGVASGMIGCLAYWKRQSLMSDALSHAALPGVVIAFAITGVKMLPVLILGAAISALIGAFLVQWVVSSSRIKEDTAMGIVLSVFFGLGIMLLTIVNRTGGGNVSGLDGFIFGQAASMVRTDVYTMSALGLVVISIVWLGFKEWKLFLFDPAFAKGLGLSVRLMNSLYSGVLVLVIVIGIQAVGVILMSALLIIPAVSARYWTHSFKWMLIGAALIGGGSGVIGTLISTMGKGWPTGPFIVVSSAAFFVVSLLFGTQKGLVIVHLQQRSRIKSELSAPAERERTVVKEGGY
ncbi:manganese ABC transporter [Bacillus sp. FJAT-27264]|uniref:metal ABC transporter permease n=1 Tax=Paenibacillus sp. (strain DSM 101736 / FJAT-27264) TaxID=1850362 RepID=UPI0008081222|nr:metal ABC transporter permease [Bacillus sp. FJAT-27264]OBZ18843.1 manganese ABC transporter [Bacillus sp. FJAT-27264]